MKLVSTGSFGHHLPIRTGKNVVLTADSWSVWVEFPPTFTQKPSGLVVPDGVRASLNCSASGNPPPSYEWLSGLDNKRVVSTDHRRYITPDGNLIFNPFNSSLDQTVYYCKAENSLSSITSEGVLLAVASKYLWLHVMTSSTVSWGDCKQLTFLLLF